MCAAEAPTVPRLSGADWLTWPATEAVFAALSSEDVETRAVGGAVRDTLFGRPVREIDLATTALPERAIELAERAGLKVVPTGLDHGTVTVVADGRPFEVTTLRADVETYGRHARVAFTDDWAVDASRRDFTINALYADASGRLYDPLSGLADVEARRVRFIGEARARIREDYLRILRFFRFNAEFGAPPYDAEGLAACVRERAGLAALSAERVRIELMRLSAANDALRALHAMFEHGLLVQVLGRVPYLARFERLTHIEAALGLAPDPVLRLAALCVAVPEDADGLRLRLKLSNAEHARLAAAARYRCLMKRPNEQEARIALYRSGARAYRDRIALAWAEWGEDPNDEAWRQLLQLPERWQAPRFPLRGQDLLELGVPSGAQLGQALKQLESEWIASDFTLDRDALLERARRLRR